MLWSYGIFETLELWDQETNEPRHQEAKNQETQNQETLKPRNQ